MSGTDFITDSMRLVEFCAMPRAVRKRYVRQKIESGEEPSKRRFMESFLKALSQ